MSPILRSTSRWCRCSSTRGALAPRSSARRSCISARPGDDSLLRYYAMRHQVDPSTARVIAMTGLEADALAQRGVPRTIVRHIGVGVTPAKVLGGDGARSRAEQQNRRPAGAVHWRTGLRQGRHPGGAGHAAAGRRAAMPRSR